MVKGFYKDLIVAIFLVLLCLGVCAGFDYADDTIDNTDTAKEIVVNNSSYVKLKDGSSYFVAKSSDKIHYKYPVIGMYAKPSCGCKYRYCWHYREFVNYCPNCHHYGTLRKNPKGVPEREYTCKRCSSDFCGVCGKEKYSWSRVYLRKC